MSLEPEARVLGSPQQTTGDGSVSRGQILSGFAWKGTSQVAIQATRFIVSIALARILAPHEFGLAGMVLVFASFVLIFADVGLGAALVQRKVLDHLDLSTAFWTTATVGAVTTALGVMLSGPIAGFFGEPRLKAMIAVLSLSFLANSLGLTQSALLVREMNFKGLEIREICATVGGGVAGLTGAIAGLGAWAIIAQQLTSAVLATVLIWHYSNWRPSRTFSFDRLRGFAAFTANVFGTTLFGQFRSTADNLLVGRFLGATSLGAYALAYNVIFLPFTRIATPLAQVLFPALSRAQDNQQRLSDYWLRALQAIAGVATPCLLGLIVLAPDFVDVVLGRSWRPATPIIQLLAVVGLFQTLQFLNPVVLQALDRTKLLFRWSIFSIAASLAAFAIGLSWGIQGVAAAYLVASVITEPAYAYLTARAAGLNPVRLLVALRGVAFAAFVMVAALLAARWFLMNVGRGPGLRLAVLVPLGAAVYLPLCAWWAGELVSELRSLRRRRQPTPDTSIASESSVI